MTSVCFTGPQVAIFMAEQIAKQIQLQRMIERSIDKFKKIGSSNLTPVKVRSRISSVKETFISSRARALEEFTVNSSNKSIGRAAPKSKISVATASTSPPSSIFKSRHLFSACPTFIRESPGKRRELAKRASRIWIKTVTVNIRVSNVSPMASIILCCT